MIVLISRPENDPKDPTKITWPIFVHMILSVPTSIIIIFYEIYFLFSAICENETREILKKIVCKLKNKFIFNKGGNLYLISVAVLSNFVLGFGFAILMQNYNNVSENTDLILFIFGSTIVYFLLALLAFPLKKQIM